MGSINTRKMNRIIELDCHVGLKPSRGDGRSSLPSPRADGDLAFVLFVLNLLHSLNAVTQFNNPSYFAIGFSLFAG